jgi:signal peptidase I
MGQKMRVTIGIVVAAVLLSVSILSLGRVKEGAASIVSTRTFKLVGPSMAPTFPEGTTVRARLYGSGADLSHSSIVVHAWPGMPDRLLVKRVIALGGDKVAIKKGVVYLNGERLEESYVKVHHPGDLSELVVPRGHVWTLGDNRSNSIDSRVLGAVPLDHVKAVVVNW